MAIEWTRRRVTTQQYRPAEGQGTADTAARSQPPRGSTVRPQAAATVGAASPHVREAVRRSSTTMRLHSRPGVDWICLGHAMWLVEASGLRLLCDPLLGP